MPPGADTGDETYAAPAPTTCPDCGGAVAVSRVASQYQEDLPDVRPLVRRFDIEVGHCSQCQRRVQGRLALQTSDALGAAGAQLGPNVAALVVELHTELGMPLEKVAHVLKTQFGLLVTSGGLVHLLHRTAAAAAPAYAALREQVRHSPVVTPDETGWRVNAIRHWLWAFTTAQTTVYAICDGRGFDDAATVLGPDFAGVLVRDGWGGVSRLQAGAAADMSGPLCRHPDYADVGAGAPATRDACAETIGIITALRGKPGGHRMADSGRPGHRRVSSCRARVLSGRGPHGCRCRSWRGVRVRATER